MKLRFLGQTYFPSRQIPTVASGDKACYRGQQYNRRLPVVNINTQPVESAQVSAIVYKYRGVSYIVERHRVDRQPNKPELCYR